ncbi:MAG: DUF2024 family protein [Limisphaerales bacterium]
MKVAVYDTYVVKKDGKTMHFDVIVPEGESHERVLAFGREYLKSVGQEGQTLTTRECKFCHVESASAEIERTINQIFEVPGSRHPNASATVEAERAIHQRGYYIKEMEGCRRD